MQVQDKKTPILHQEIIYPDSDGKPMADNTLQFLWIAMLYDNLRGLFFGQDVFVAGDHLWYPVEGDPKIRIAPDVMVAFGRPDIYRGSYKQWLEEDTPPHVVIEVLSPSNTPMEMLAKLDFYERYGVSEFIILDPEKNEFVAYVNENGKLVRADNTGQVWKSPKLGIGFGIKEEILVALHSDGTPLKTFSEIQAEKEALKVEKDELKTEKDAAVEAKESALKEVEQLKARLRELGEDAD